jgi:hypothetical protein
MQIALWVCGVVLMLCRRILACYRSSIVPCIRLLVPAQLARGAPVRRALGSVDQLVSQALRNGLDVAEGGLAGAGGQQEDGLVHTAQGGDIHSLAADHTGGADTGGILTGTAAEQGRVLGSASALLILVLLLVVARLSAPG